MAVEKKQKDVVLETEETVAQELHIEETVEENVVEEKEPLMPLSFVEKLMREMEEKLTNTFNLKLNKLNLLSAQKELDGDLDYVKDLEDDWLDAPVVFFAFSFNFSIHGDKKRGAEDVPPHGALRFQPLIRTKKRGVKGNIQVVSVSSVKVQSREVVDYLRNHSQFGIAFYENMESAMNVDATWAQKMIEAQQSIARLSDTQIIARAKQEGISVSQSPEMMRKQLVETIAKRSIAQQEKMLYGGIKNSIVDQRGRSIVEKTIA